MTETLQFGRAEPGATGVAAAGFVKAGLADKIPR